MQTGDGHTPPAGGGRAEPLPKLRLAPDETPEELAHRSERERRAAEVQREDRLGSSLAPFRVGSVPHLNAVPLTRGLEDQVLYRQPTELEAMLLRDELDAARIGSGALQITQLQPEGGKPLDARAFLNGGHAHAGDVLSAVPDGSR